MLSSHNLGNIKIPFGHFLLPVQCFHCAFWQKKPNWEKVWQFFARYLESRWRENPFRHSRNFPIFLFPSLALFHDENPVVVSHPCWRFCENGCSILGLWLKKICFCKQMARWQEISTFYSNDSLLHNDFSEIDRRLIIIKLNVSAAKLASLWNWKIEHLFLHFRSLRAFGIGTLQLISRTKFSFVFEGRYISITCIKLNSIQ